MSAYARRRFWIGGGGALLPLLVTLIATDLSSIIDHYDQLTPGLIVGTVIRYMALFVLGGVVAMANTDERKAIKLVQLGIAAPALISSYLNVGSPSGGKVSSMVSLGVVAEAQAAEPARRADATDGIQVAGFLRDVLRGSTGTVGEAVQQDRPPAESERAREPREPAPSAEPSGESRAQRREALERRKLELEQELKALEAEEKGRPSE